MMTRPSSYKYNYVNKHLEARGINPNEHHSHNVNWTEYGWHNNNKNVGLPPWVSAAPINRKHIANRLKTQLQKDINNQTLEQEELKTQLKEDIDNQKLGQMTNQINRIEKSIERMTYTMDDLNAAITENISFKDSKVLYDRILNSIESNYLRHKYVGWRAFVSKHGSIHADRLRFFKVPENVILVYMSPLGYATCMNINNNSRTIYADPGKMYDFLKHPYSGSYPLLKNATIIPPGQMSIDLDMGFDQNGHRPVMFASPIKPPAKDGYDLATDFEQQNGHPITAQGYFEQLAGGKAIKTPHGSARHTPYRQPTRGARSKYARHPNHPLGPDLRTLKQYCDSYAHARDVCVIIVDACRTIYSRGPGASVYCNYTRKIAEKRIYLQPRECGTSRMVNLNLSDPDPKIKHLQEYKAYEENISTWLHSS